MVADKMGVALMVETSLVPNALYWARSPKHFDGEDTVVQVSTIFGEHPDFWTLALLGTEEHAMPGDFEIVAPVNAPEHRTIRLAAE